MAEHGGSVRFDLLLEAQAGHLTPLDLPLTRIARRLASRDLLMIVALGSSSTAGPGAGSPEATYPSRLMVELAQRFRTQPIMVLNRGISESCALTRRSCADGLPRVSNGLGLEATGIKARILKIVDQRLAR